MTRNSLCLGVALALLLLQGCGKISEPDEVEGSGGTQDFEPMVCLDARLRCETYFPERLGCSCDASAPETEGDCPDELFFDCDVRSPDWGCRCQSEAPTSNHYERRGCLSAFVSIESDGTMVNIVPLCADEVMGASNGAVLPSWVKESSTPIILEACLTAEHVGDVSAEGELAGLDSCACVEAGGTPVMGMLPEIGSQYVGCGKRELLLSARVQDEGFCARPMSASAWDICAWFPSAFAPVGWSLSPCASCDAER